MGINLNMKRKSYMVIMLVIIFIIILLSETLGHNKYEKIFIFNFSLSICFFYTGYLLIVKKSYNLLAGMTGEELERIQENIEVKMKYDKSLKIIGYIIFIGGIVVLFLGLSYLFK